MGVAFVAAFLKGITGTGLGTTVVSIASLVVGVKQAVALAALLSLYAGVGMVRAGNVPVRSHYFLVVCGSVVCGTALGAQLLKIVSLSLAEVVMAVMLIVVGTIFVFDLQVFRKKHLLERPPLKASALDMVMAFCAGLSTGFIGISLPVLFFHFGRSLSKDALRHLIVLLFIPSAAVQVTIFAMNGLLSQSLLFGSLLLLPALLLGLYAGNKVFHLLSEQRFRQLLGVFLYCVALKLIA